MVLKTKNPTKSPMIPGSKLVNPLNLYQHLRVFALKPYNFIFFLFFSSRPAQCIV